MAEVMNIIMKKYLFTAAAMMVAMTSCVKEADVVVPQDDDKVWVEFAAGVQTKVALNDGETNTVTWEKDDKVSINGVEFAVKNESISDDKTSATFGAYVEPSFLEADNFTAVYPVEAVSWEGEYAPKVTIPTVQDGAANIVAMATVDDLESALAFRHVASFIKFQVPAEVKTVTISAEEVVAGKVKKVAFAEVESVTTISYEAVEGQKTITVSLGADASFQPETVYYAAVLPGAKTNFTLTFGDKVYKTWETLNIKQGRILNVKEKADRNLAYKLSDEVVTEVAYTMGTEFTAPVLTGEMTGVVYASSNTEVATVSETGKVTILAVGITTITASAEENNTHLARSASYTLTVNKAARTLTFTESALEVTYGADVTEPTLNGVNDDETVVYTSSDETVATVDASGAVTVIKAGQTTITATVAATETHETASAEYTLTVNKADRNLSFSKKSATAKIEGEEFAEPTLSGEKTGVEYTSSNTTIATVDKSTGEIKALKAGTVTITANAAANDTHNAGSVSYTLTVKEPSLWRLVGKFNGVDKWSKADGSIPMYAVSGQTNTYVAENVKLTSNDIWKFLYNDEWDTSKGGGWVGSYDGSNWDGNVYAEMQNNGTDNKYGSHHSYNSHKSNFGATAGTYDIYLTVGALNSNAQVWVIKKQ